MKNIDESSLIDFWFRKKKNTDRLGRNIHHVKGFRLQEIFCGADIDGRWIKAYRD